MSKQVSAADLVDSPRDLEFVGKRFGLSEATVKHLQRICSEHRKMPAKKGKERSLREQHQALVDVEEAATRLRTLLETLPFNEFVNLKVGLVSLVSDPFEALDPSSPQKGSVRDNLRSLIEGARAARGRLPSDGTRGGRPKSLDRLLKFVQHIALTLEPENIAPSKTRGKFMAICASCFQEAGVPSGPEGAVRALVAKHRGVWRRLEIA